MLGVPHSYSKLCGGKRWVTLHELEDGRVPLPRSPWQNHFHEINFMEIQYNCLCTCIWYRKYWSFDGPWCLWEGSFDVSVMFTNWLPRNIWYQEGGLDYFSLCTGLVISGTHKTCSRAGTNLAKLKDVVYGECTTMQFDIPCFSFSILISYGLCCWQFCLKTASEVISE